MKVKLLVRIGENRHGSIVDLSDLKLDKEREKALLRRRLLVPQPEPDPAPEPAPKKKAAPKVDHKPSLSDGDL